MNMFEKRQLRMMPKTSQSRTMNNATTMKYFSPSNAHGPRKGEQRQIPSTKRLFSVIYCTEDDELILKC